MANKTKIILLVDLITASRLLCLYLYATQRVKRVNQICGQVKKLGRTSKKSSELKCLSVSAALAELFYSSLHGGKAGEVLHLHTCA